MTNINNLYLSVIFIHLSGIWRFRSFVLIFQYVVFGNLYIHHSYSTMEREEGEMSDNNAMDVDDDSDNLTIYKADKGGVQIKKIDKMDASKLEERVKRFGLKKVVTQKQIDKLYSYFEVHTGNQRHFRLDTLHLHGVKGLDTADIFEYLEDYKPLSFEWIDSSSCNVVCQDHISAAITLLLHSREIKNEELQTMLSDKSTHRWREGMPHPKKDLILMRFATNGDKKGTSKKTESSFEEYYDQSNDSNAKNPWGDLCKTWGGVYDHQEFLNRQLHNVDYDEECEDGNEKIKIKNSRLAHRLGKRRKNDRSEDSNSDSEWKRKAKTPRMRMHADDEESKQKEKVNFDSTKDEDPGPFTPLSIEVVNSRKDYTPREDVKLSDKFKKHGYNTSTKKNSIHSRLGVKVVSAQDTWSSDESSSDSSIYNTMSRVQKVSTQKKSDSSVWSRLDTKSNAHSDLREILKSRKNKHEDLREIISKSKKSNLCIEIDNNLCK